MISEKDEEFNLWKMPRHGLGKTERPGLLDYIGSDELLDVLLPHLFGAHFPKNELIPVPYSIDKHRFLQVALETGKILAACEKILDALRSGALTLQVARLKSKDQWSQPHRVSASDLNDLSAGDVVGDFLEGACLGPDSDCPEWIHGKTFFLQDVAVEHWVKSLEPMSHLPDVVKRDGDLLPNRHISASEAICWVAGQEIRDWYGLIEACAEIRDTIAALEEYDSGAYDNRYYLAAQNLCLLLAEKHVRSHAANETIRLMAEGRLTGYGVPDHQKSNAAHSVFKKIPETAFLIQREFSSNGKFTDCLVAATTGHSIEDQQASNEADWTHVRYERNDLVGIWGDATAPIDKTATTSTDFDGKKSNAPRGRRAKYNWAGLHSHLDELWNYHGPLDETDPDWGRQADVEQAAMKWFIDQIDEHPAESTIRDRVSLWIKIKNSEAAKG